MSFSRLQSFTKLFTNSSRGKATDVGCMLSFVDTDRVFDRPLYQQDPTNMISSSMKSNTKEVGNVNVSGRLKQIFILILAILVGMVISAIYSGI